MSFIYFLTFFVAVSSCLLVCLIFRKLNFVDKPDGVRKTHKGEIPVGGGLALYIAVYISFFIFMTMDISEINSERLEDLSVIWNVSIIILILGLVDDLKPLPISIRLIVQILASWLVVLISDIYITDLGDLFGLGNIYLGQLGIPITIFMVVGLTNAFNMLDGMDGLVAFVTLVAFISLAVLAFLIGYMSLLLLISISLAAFLLFNLGLLGDKLKLFLGDSGSMMLGFTLAWFLVTLSQGEERLLNPVNALWIILLPLIDSLSTFVSRLWNKKPVFVGDRSHIHHILLDSGLVKWKVLLIFTIISGFSAVIGVFSYVNLVKEYYLFYGFLTLWFFYFLLIKFPNNK